MVKTSYLCLGVIERSQPWKTSVLISPEVVLSNDGDIIFGLEKVLSYYDDFTNANISFRKGLDKKGKKTYVILRQQGSNLLASKMTSRKDINFIEKIKD